MASDTKWFKGAESISRCISRWCGSHKQKNVLITFSLYISYAHKWIFKCFSVQILLGIQRWHKISWHTVTSPPSLSSWSCGHFGFFSSSLVLGMEQLLGSWQGLCWVWIEDNQPCFLLLWMLFGLSSCQFSKSYPSKQDWMWCTFTGLVRIYFRGIDKFISDW